MPLKYWDEAFLAATFLINHTHKLHYHLGTPFQCQAKLLILENLWLFMLATSSAIQLKKVRILIKRMCSNIHKGFKCLDLSTGRIYISCDVIFDENMLAFTKLKPNTDPRLRE
jgi:hypothetical protein